MSEAGAHRQRDENGGEEPKVVVRDRRKIDPGTGAVRDADVAGADAGAAGGQMRPPSTSSGRSPSAPSEGEMRPPATPSGSPSGPSGGTGEQSVPGGDGREEVAALRAQLVERTADLQRITAEYANYRKRVDRDRVTVVDGATRSVLTGLLPVLDDVERAREHGDLTGAFKAVADQLERVLEKLGLRPFGAAGDPFDPTLHEAVAHQTSPDVTVPTCAQVLRRGYRHGDRLLRPALVAVVDPEPARPSATEPIAPSDLPGSDAVARADERAEPADGGGIGDLLRGRREGREPDQSGQPGQPISGLGD